MRRRKGIERKIAIDHITELFDQAKTNSKFSKRYISLLRKYSTRLKIPLPLEIRRSFCKDCNSLLAGNCRVRIKPGKKPIKIITCLSCGQIKRVGLTPKQ